MKSNTYFILILLVTVVAAPVVDATVCKECSDHALPGPQRLTISIDHAAALQSNHGAPSQGKNTVQDLCPFCANNAAAMISLTDGDPTTVSQTYHFFKLLPLSDPSRSINKPPQN